MSPSKNNYSLSSNSREFERLSGKQYRSGRTSELHARKNNRSNKSSYAKTIGTTQTRPKPHKRASQPKSKAGVLFTPKNIRSGPALSTYDSQQQPVIWGIGLIVRRIVITLAILVMLALLIIGTRYISQKASYSSVGTQMNLISTETTDASDEDSEEDSAADDTADSDEDSEEESSTDTTDSSDDTE